jgi:hypothetical protein
MLDTTSNPGDYPRLFWMKLPFLGFLALAEQLYLLDHYSNFCQTYMLHVTNEMNELRQEVTQHHFMSQEELEATLFVMQHLLSEWQSDLEYARSWRARLVARAETLPENAPPPREIAE